MTAPLHEYGFVEKSSAGSSSCRERVKLRPKGLKMKHRLKRSSGYFFAAVLIACSLGLQVTNLTVALASTKYDLYSTQYYNIWYNSADSAGIEYAKGIEPYLGKAYNAALSVIGNDYRYPSQQGKLNIKLYQSDDSSYGYMSPARDSSGTYVNLNTYYLKDYPYAAWGSTVAHETAHIMFFNYTKADRWNSALLNYSTFLTEALSWYAGDCVYGWADHKTSTPYSAAYIRSQVKHYSALYGKEFSWYDTGKAYADVSSDGDLQLAIWNLRAIGSFLTDDKRTETSSNLKTLLTTLRNSETQLCGSAVTSKEAISAFEEAFKTAYGKYANSNWKLTGRATATSDVSYLYGDFYKRFYQ
jgi:hypothetical protein